MQALAPSPSTPLISPRLLAITSPRSSSPSPRSDPAADTQALLARTPVRVVLFDFDQTVVDCHTAGGWRHALPDLAKHVKPDFVALVPVLVSMGMTVGIVTYSDDANTTAERVAGAQLIKSFLAHIFHPTLAERIPVAAAYPPLHAEMPKGKTWHMYEILRTARPDCQLANCVLFDDDPNNVFLASQLGVSAFQVPTTGFSYLDWRRAVTWLVGKDRIPSPSVDSVTSPLSPELPGRQWRRCRFCNGSFGDDMDRSFAARATCPVCSGANGMDVDCE